MEGYLFLVVYLLIGCQIGGRMFFWSTEGKKDIISNIYCLIIVPCIWPLFMVLSVLPKGQTYHNAIFDWSKRDFNGFDKQQ